MQLLFAIVFLLIVFIVPVWYFVDVFSSMFFWDDRVVDIYLKNLNILMFLRKEYVMFIVISLWTALYFGIKYWIEWQEEKQRSEDALNMVQKAQLQMLRYQLNPHFLFNSLNSIKALVNEDQAAAKQMITELSDFLRYSLKDKDVAFRPLKEELDALRLYLSIEKKRFEEKLHISYDITEATYDKQVLSFLLHPLIENAIKYGMKSSELPLDIRISAYVADPYLIIEIYNSGRWFEYGEATGIHGTGTGLENVKKRLENAYASDYIFNIEKGRHFVCVKIAIKTDAETTK